MRSKFETITVERQDNDILLIALNRPEAADALNTQMGLDLMELFEGLTIDIEGLKVAILTAYMGPRHSARAAISNSATA
jgi:enoyl-CoA hydratase